MPIIAEVRARYDLVIVDCSPITLVSDAIPLLRYVDGVLLVASMRKTRRDTSKRLHLQLQHLGVRVFGVVANRVARGRSGYDAYSYGPEGFVGTEHPEITSDTNAVSNVRPD